MGPGLPGEIDGKPRVLIAKKYGSENLDKKPATGMSNEDYAGNFEVFLEEIDSEEPLVLLVWIEGAASAI